MNHTSDVNSYIYLLKVKYYVTELKTKIILIPVIYSYDILIPNVLWNFNVNINNSKSFAILNLCNLESVFHGANIFQKILSKMIFIL